MSELTAFFLNADELETLTGFKSPCRQSKWLSAKGWRFVLSGNGRPIIARKYAEKMLGCGSEEEHHPTTRPNFGALVRRV